jgi:uncharacterized membrane protein
MMTKWLHGGIVTAAWVFSLAAYSRLPDRVPTHWGLDGQVDGWSGRTIAAFMLPTAMIGIWALLYFLPIIDPRRENYVKFRGTYDTIVAAVLAVMLVIHGVALSNGLGYDVPVGRVVPFAVGGLLVLIGNLLPRARPNWFVGIRTPWTLSNDRVWERTHRVGGLAIVIAGIAMIGAGVFPGAWSVGLAIAIAVATSGFTIIYSYIAWRQETRG